MLDKTLKEFGKFEIFSSLQTSAQRRDSRTFIRISPHLINPLICVFNEATNVALSVRLRAANI